MDTIMNREKANEARTLYDNYSAYMSSPFGEKLRAKLDEIDSNAANKALRGDTPPNTNVFFESRGRVGAIFQINQMFKDIEKGNEDAILWLQNNPPREDAASENVE